MSNDDAAIRRRRIAQTRAKAFRMRREGANLDTIATRLGVSRSSARRMVEREMRTLAEESAIDERRLVHTEALMDLWRSLYGPATNGEPAAVEQFLKVEERIARLLGLDRDPGSGDSIQIVVPGSEGATTSRSKRFSRDEAELAASYED